METNFIKPATVTSVGLIMVAASLLAMTPPVLVKVGAGLIIAGSVWFLVRTR